MQVNRELFLRILVGIYFIFVSIILLADWLPQSYLLNQGTILVLGLLAIRQPQRMIEIELLMLTTCISIIIDSVAIGMYFEIGKSRYNNLAKSGYFSISACFAIILLILKPIILMCLQKIRQARINDEVFDTYATRSGYIPVMEN
ncbi:unnamed protein product [Adineta ricciae]|uniref:Uncharacterized protein n=1 Tax=Adineta ricciae TaxID=249248 RepID=A0A815A4F6_ADIRI|nr:unnamed protein product [Adineta ricciae]